MKQSKKRIEKFKKSIDFRDICYFITHVKNIEYRKSLLQDLGYHVGIEITRDKQSEGNVYIGKKKDLRMFISNKFPHVNIAYSVILEKY